MTRRAAVLAPWPAAAGASFVLLLGRLWGCNPDPTPYGNAWTEDHNGYCTHSGWEAMTSGAAEFLLAGALLVVTIGLPLLTLVASSFLTGRGWLVWGLTIAASLAVVVFFVVAGHVTIVGGAGG